jgi:hypothetical protein
MRRQLAMPSIRNVLLGPAMLVCLISGFARAQEPYQYETDLTATKRVFDAAGAGFRAIHKGPHGYYYILTAPATSLQIYDPAGKRVTQIPAESAASAKSAALIYGESFDVNSDGRVAVCDRSANAVKIYGDDGALLTVIPFPYAASVAWVTGDEVAVASPNAPHLMTVYDLKGNLVRDYGDREEIADNADINNLVNLGDLASDGTGNTYFAFGYLPEPTVRRYDRVGYLTLEISLTTLEFQPAAQAARRAIARSESRIPALHRIITAIGVDPQTQEIWLAIGTQLMRFDKEGTRLATFRTYIPGGARLESSAILVEPERLLIGADPLGIYEFRKPKILPR